MKELKLNEPHDISIFVPNVHLGTMLTDNRLIQRYGKMKFGTIGQLASNLGISVKSENGGLTFTAPKRRVQMFAEKLHFALIGYRQV